MSLLEQYAALDAHVMRFVDRMVSWAGMNRAETERILDGVGAMDDFADRFHAAGAEWERRADEAQAKGRGVTSGEWRFFAFCCYRVADFCYSKDGSGRFDAYESSVACFNRAAATFPDKPEPLTIEFEGERLPGYLVVPTQASTPCPAVAAIYGADGNKEDHYRGTILPAVRRGIAALIVDGPGQGATRRRKGVPLRHDTEAFARVCLDALLADPRIDGRRIGVVGTSFGGYSAVRALALEPRFKAGVAISGLYDVITGLWDPYPPVRPQLVYNLAARSEADALEKLKSFTLDDVIERGEQPLAIFHGEADPLIPPSQARLIHQRWRGPKSLVVWPGANHNLHNVAFQADAEIWDWIDAALRA